MKNKKGFTLVELLAVIAILAILVIIALPNVINMYNKARREVFLIEAKNIYKEASKRFVTGSFDGENVILITSKENGLDISNKDYEYKIKLDKNGKVGDFRVSNKNFCIKGKFDDASDLTSDKIETEYCDVFDYSPKPTECTFDGELSTGAEFINGQYTYRYNQIYVGNGWSPRNLNGWGVTLTDKESTEPVTSKVCTNINGKPIVSTSSMFNSSKAESIDLTSFSTKNVTDMGNMFYNSEAKSIIGLNNFNTSKVITMASMFQKSKALELDLSTFDTSNVTNMSSMFTYSAAEELDLSAFNTSKVNTMYAMFADSDVKKINVSSFDTSNVTTMGGMFKNTKFSSIDISNFDTKNVKVMNWMFQGTLADELDLTKLNTGNVTHMQGMFMNGKTTIIKGLENFDTKNVIDMSSMFNCSSISKIDVSHFDTGNVINMWGMFRFVTVPKIYGLENFNTSNVTDMSHMFSLSKLEEVDVSHFDTSNVTNMNLMFYIMDKIKIIDLSNFNIDNVTSMNEMFFGNKATVGYARNEADASRYNDNSVTKISDKLRFIVK